MENIRTYNSEDGGAQMGIHFETEIIYDDIKDFDREFDEDYIDEDEEWEDWPDYVFDDVRYVSYDNRSNIDYDRMTDNEIENYLMFGEMPD